jgi:hypothetical protein
VRAVGYGGGFKSGQWGGARRVARAGEDGLGVETYTAGGHPSDNGGRRNERGE